MPKPPREQEGVHIPVSDTDRLTPNRRDKGGSPGLMHFVGDFGQGPRENRAPTNTASGRAPAVKGLIEKNPRTSDQRWGD